MVAETRQAVASEAIGAYGLRLENVEQARPLLVPASPEWPRIRVECRVGRGQGGVEWLSDKAARLQLQDGGEIALDRESGSAAFLVPREVGAEELVHPLLAPVAAVTAYWFGRESFHAAAFVTGSIVWGLIGDREAGKSTMVARLALDGVGIACDDMLVLEGDRVHVAPRSVDLRRDAAERLGAGEPLGVVGARERWRLRVPPVPQELKLGGWVSLAWGERVEAVPLRGPDRLLRLRENLGTKVPPRDPSALLELAALPGWELRRPQSWDALSATVDCLLETVG